MKGNTELTTIIKAEFAIRRYYKVKHNLKTTCYLHYCPATGLYRVDRVDFVKKINSFTPPFIPCTDNTFLFKYDCGHYVVHRYDNYLPAN